VVLKVGGKEVKNILNVKKDIVYNEGADIITVKRGDSTVELKYDDKLRRQLNSRDADFFVYARSPFIINKVSKNSNAEKTGIKVNDQVVGVNGIPTAYYDEYIDIIKDKKSEKLALAILRGADTLTITVEQDTKGRIGVERKNLKELGFQFDKRNYSFLQAIPAGFTECWSTLGNYIKGIKQLFNGKARASESVGSVFSIGGIYPGVWDWHIFWTLTAVFSVILAFMNILPIPGLDGGHALFTLVEMITGRKPSDKFLEYAQIVGMVLLFGLMAYALGLDIFRMFK
jgi:regulator of sigma E protease